MAVMSSYLHRRHVKVPEEVLHLFQQLRAQRHLVGLQLLHVLRRVPASVGDPWHFGADPAPDPDQDPTPDPPPFFINF